MRTGRAAARTAVLVAVWGAAIAVTGAYPPTPQVRVILRPAMAKLGERVTYRVEVIGGFWRKVAWLPPDSGSAFSWGEARHGISNGRPRHGERFGVGARAGRIQEGTPDTAWAEIPLQVFELGVVSVPGIGFRYLPLTESTPTQQVVARAPTARLVMIPVLTAADSNTTLRPLHGPLAAPWWERVPWRWVAVAVLALALAWALFRALRRRRQGTPGQAPQAAPLTPAAQALAALATLRTLALPQQQRFAEHAFRLGQILRRYLEATVPATQPGDTTPELVRHLGEAGLSAEDLKRLAGLLRVWDRVKFAREPFTADEAARAEVAVEGYVRRASGTVNEEAA